MSQLPEHLVNDPDGMATYDYIVNNVDGISDHLPMLIQNLRDADRTGQFLSSSARFLAAVDKERFGAYIATLVEYAIEKDRERRYIGSLLESIWGADYKDRADVLWENDNNFRRIYKRIFPVGM